MAFGDAPNRLSLAPSRRLSLRPICRSMASGPTKGVVGGIKATMGVGSGDVNSLPTGDDRIFSNRVLAQWSGVEFCFPPVKIRCMVHFCEKNLGLPSICLNDLKLLGAVSRRAESSEFMAKGIRFDQTGRCPIDFELPGGTDL